MPRNAAVEKTHQHWCTCIVLTMRSLQREATQLLCKCGHNICCVAEGLGGEEIADRLYISLRTTRNHIANILSRLGVHSQLQALVFALRHGVVQLP